MDPVDTILNEIMLAQSKNEQLKKIVLQLEHESDVIIKQFEQKVEELQKKIKHEQDEKLRLTRKIETSVRESEVESATYLEKIYGLETTVRNYDLRMQSIEASHAGELELRDQQITDQSEKITDLQNSLELREKEYRESCRQLSAQVSDLNKQMESDKDSFITEIDLRNQKITSLNEEILSLSDKFREEKVKYNQSVQNLLKHLESERDTRTREINERDQAILSLQHDLDRLAEETRHLSVQHSEEISALSREIKNKTSMLHQLSEEAEKTKKAREDDQKAWDLERNRFSREIRDLSTSFQNRIVSLQDDISSLSGNLEEKERRIGQLEKDKEDLSDSLSLQISGLQAEITDKNVQIEKNLVSLEEKSREARTLTDEITQLKDTVQKSEVFIGDLQVRAEKERLTLLEEISGLKKDLLDLRDKYGEEIGGLQEKLGDLEAERETLVNSVQQREAFYQDGMARLHGELGDLQRSKDLAEEKLAGLQEKLADLVTERDALVYSGQQREEFYRSEVARLHGELGDLQGSKHLAEEELKSEIDSRNKIIVDLTGNNESIRSELTKVRTQLTHLKDLIRTEKDESVHALYEEIHALQESLSRKDMEIKKLSAVVIRLDKENTGLHQQISDLMADSLDNQETAGEIISEPVLSGQQKPDPILAGLIADLDDPSRAPEATGNLVRLGTGIVDTLIPLLHSGSIQRRIWVAVALYEINDNRATAPLVSFLENPSNQFRELIWEAKVRYQQYKRSAQVPPSLPEQKIK